MRKKIAKTGFVSLTLGALGCGGPERPEAVRPPDLFGSNFGRVDSRQGDGWRKFLGASALHAAWVPPPASPWRAFYKPTLICAVSIVQSAALPASPKGGEALADRLARRLGWERAAVIVDLAGEDSVAWSAVLARYGFQPVVTFNNWPHQQGVLRLERPLGALIYYAGEMAERKKEDLARPVFALDRSRLSPAGLATSGAHFDNRYFHGASDFPSASELKVQVIDRIYYVSARPGAPGAEEDDLNLYFTSLAQAGIKFSYVDVTGGNLEVREAQPVARTTIFTHAETAQFASSSPYGRSYSHYHYFWSNSRSTWGSSSFTSGRSGFSS